MTRMLLDADLANRLQTAHQPVELCDPKGTVVGTFFPKPVNDLYRTVRVPFTQEELDRAAQEPGGRSLARIRADRLRVSGSTVPAANPQAAE